MLLPDSYSYLDSDSDLNPGFNFDGIFKWGANFNREPAGPSAAIDHAGQRAHGGAVASTPREVLRILCGTTAGRQPEVAALVSRTAVRSIARDVWIARKCTVSRAAGKRTDSGRFAIFFCPGVWSRPAACFLWYDEPPPRGIRAWALTRFSWMLFCRSRFVFCLRVQRTGLLLCVNNEMIGANSSKSTNYTRVLKDYDTCM